MRTVQLTIDPDLVKKVDAAARKLGVTRSAFARDAFRQALRKIHEARLDQKHREGYKRIPVKPGEFDVWEKEQAWGDDESW
jgi:metal-responsive CopG/Arc/MetJ family transcriptional regulator